MLSMFLNLETYFPKSECLIERSKLDQIYGFMRVEKAISQGFLRQGTKCCKGSDYCWLTNEGRDIQN